MRAGGREPGYARAACGRRCRGGGAVVRLHIVRGLWHLMPGVKHVVIHGNFLLNTLVQLGAEFLRELSLHAGELFLHRGSEVVFLRAHGSLNLFHRRRKQRGERGGQWVTLPRPGGVGGEPLDKGVGRLGGSPPPMSHSEDKNAPGERGH